eukprot:m.346782 g.346782  ORF g.346782 m.346782 type:complete len:396 (+) comp30358_c0_seq1:80-1267(+)
MAYDLHLRRMAEFFTDLDSSFELAEEEAAINQEEEKQKTSCRKDNKTNKKSKRRICARESCSKFSLNSEPKESDGLELKPLTSIDIVEREIQEEKSVTSTLMSFEQDILSMNDDSIASVPKRPSVRHTFGRKVSQSSLSRVLDENKAKEKNEKVELMDTNITVLSKWQNTQNRETWNADNGIHSVQELSTQSAERKNQKCKKRKIMNQNKTDSVIHEWAKQSPKRQRAKWSRSGDSEQSAAGIVPAVYGKQNPKSYQQRKLRLALKESNSNNEQIANKIEGHRNETDGDDREKNEQAKKEESNNEEFEKLNTIKQHFDEVDEFSLTEGKRTTWIVEDRKKSPLTEATIRKHYPHIAARWDEVVASGSLDPEMQGNLVNIVDHMPIQDTFELVMSQ